MSIKKNADPAPVPAASKPAKTAVSDLMPGNTDDALHPATELQKFAKAHKLASLLQNKALPNAEAWQTADGRLGLASMREAIENRSTGVETNWQATVQVVHLAAGNVAGRGLATCSNKESTKKFFADYASASMAQTRAVGKAYRLALGGLMKATSYEAALAKEMQGLGAKATVVGEPAAPTPEPIAVQTLAPPKPSSPDKAVKTVLKATDRE